MNLKSRIVVRKKGDDECFTGEVCGRCYVNDSCVFLKYKRDLFRLDTKSAMILSFAIIQNGYFVCNRNSYAFSSVF